MQWKKYDLILGKAMIFLQFGDKNDYQQFGQSTPSSR